MSAITFSSNRLRLQIAAAAAAIIAEECAPWASARARALEDAGISPRTKDAIPSAEEIESAVREHFSIFNAEEHAAHILRQRSYALSLLDDLSEFDAYLAGSVLNGAAGYASNIKIEIFCDDVKSVEIRLMELGLPFEAIEAENSAMPAAEESLGFLVSLPGIRDLQGVRIDIYSTKHLGLNPYKRKPDAHQQPWESCGRINRDKLRTALFSKNTYPR